MSFAAIEDASPKTEDGGDPSKLVLPESGRVSVSSRSRTPNPNRSTTGAVLRRTPSRQKRLESQDLDFTDNGAILGDGVLITLVPGEDGRNQHPAYSSDEEDYRSFAGSPTWKQLTEHEADNGYDTDLEENEKPENGEDSDSDSTGSKDYIRECNRLGVIPANYFLRHCHKRTFSMRNHGLGPSGAKAIAKPFTVNTVIERLDLEGNCIEARGAGHIARMLRENIFISELILSENDIGSEGAHAVCEMMMDNRIIKHLDLSGNNLKDTDGEMFYKVLEKNTILQRLCLSHNHFEHHAASWFREGLAANESLRALDLSWNHLRLQGARRISEGVQENYGLKELNLSMNGFGYEGAKHMGHALRHNQSLSALDLSHNRIPSEGVLEIAKALKVNENLSAMKLGSNPISPAGTVPLIMAIQRNEGSSMAFLSLQGIMVLEEFDTIQQTLHDTPRCIQVVHAGIISDKEIKLPPPRRIDAEALFWSDPMTKLKRYAAAQGFRLVDVFKQFDRDNSWTVDRDEFLLGVSSKKIPLTEEEIDILISRLDQDGDGEIDYKELADGDEDNRTMQFKMHNLKKQREEEEKNKPPTPVERDILADSDED